MQESLHPISSNMVASQVRSNVYNMLCILISEDKAGTYRPYTACSVTFQYMTAYIMKGKWCVIGIRVDHEQIYRKYLRLTDGGTLCGTF
jgi:hypothetical protein